LAREPDVGNHKAEVLLLLGDDLLLEGKTEEGVKRIEESRRTEPALPKEDAAYADGLLAEDFEQAITAFSKALELERSHVSAYRQLIMTLMLSGRREDARRRAEMGRYLFPEDINFPFLLAVIAAFEEDQQKMDSYLGRITNLDEETRQTMRRLLDHLRLLSASVRDFEAPDALETGWLTTVTMDLDRAQKLGLSFPHPPVVERVYGPVLRDFILIPFALTRPRAVKALEEAAGKHPDARIHFLRGLALLPDLDNSPLHKEVPPAQREKEVKLTTVARDAFKAAADGPSMFPRLRAEALYAAAMMEMRLFLLGQQQSLPESVKYVRQRVIEGGPLKPHQAWFLFPAVVRVGDEDLAWRIYQDREKEWAEAAYNSAKQWKRYTLARRILADMASPTSKRFHGGEMRWLREAVKLELDAGEPLHALNEAEQVLKQQPEDAETRQLRQQALQKLRERLDATARDDTPP
jgi:tetratricopeptide (TPR) repeat protein